MPGKNARQCVTVAAIVAAAGKDGCFFATPAACIRQRAFHRVKNALRRAPHQLLAADKLCDGIGVARPHLGHRDRGFGLGAVWSWFHAAALLSVLYLNCTCNAADFQQSIVEGAKPMWVRLPSTLPTGRNMMPSSTRQ